MDVADLSVVSLLLVAALVSQALAQAADQPGVGGSAFHKNDITYSTQVATPHLPWATRLPGGPIKGFFIPSVQYGRDMVELMQRLDLQPTTVSIDREWDINCWGIGDYYGHQERGDRDDFQVVYGYVEQDLTGPATFDVIVIPGLNGWSRMTRPSRDAILRRVSQGAGLVLIHPFLGDVKGHPFAGDEAEGDPRLWDISPLVDCPDDTVRDDGYPERNAAAITQGKWEVARPHFITRGIPLDLLPEGALAGKFYRYRAAGDVLIRSGDCPILAVGHYGKGRVVALAYVDQGFLPEPVEEVPPALNWDYWEYQYALLARCIIWAAGRDPAVQVMGFTASPAGVDIALTAPGQLPVDLEIDGVSEFGQEIGSIHARVQLAPGQNHITHTGFRPSPGRNAFRLLVRDPQTGATLDFAAAALDLPKPAALSSLRLQEDVYRRGQTLSAVARAHGNLAGLSLRFRVWDDLARLLCSQTTPAVADATFEYPLADFLGRYASATVELLDANGVVLDRARTAPAYVAPDHRRDREYRASIGFASLRPYFSALRLQLINAAGVQAGTTWTEGVDNELDIPNSYFGVYWYRRGPTTPEAMEAAIAHYERTGDFDSLAYNTKVELYRRTRDKRFLVRTPCFDDEAVLRDLYDRCYASARAKAHFNMDYYFVGDEGSLTSYTDPFDFCWSPHTLSAFRNWLRQQYGSLDALNQTWNTSFADWDSVVPYTTEEAAATGSFAPWADHRTYMEIAFARAYQTVRDGVLAADPDGHIAVSGTQVTTAYNGCDWYRLDQVIDDFLSYAGGNQWDLHRSFAKPGAMIGFWTGYGSAGLGVQRAIWDAAVHNVLYPNIFWIYSYLNPDFTYSKSARDMAEAFKALRFEGVGRLFAESQRLHDGIAIHFSMPSVHGTTIYEVQRGDQQQLRQLPGARNGFVQLVNDLGLQFDFLASEQIEKGALASGRYRVLLMPLSVALSPDEVRAITAFARRGGVVIADAGAGMMDHHCAWRDDSAVDDLFGILTPPSNQRLLGRIPGPVAVTDEGAAWGLQRETLHDLEAVEPLKAAAGVALLRIADTDAVVAHPVGKGWTIYLNVCPDAYGRRARRRRGPEAGPPPPDAEAAYRALLGGILSHLDINPAVRVLDASGQPLTGAQIVRYRLGDSEALAIVTQAADARAAEGRDGVTIYHDQALGDIALQQITIRLPRACHVANARTGESLGRTDAITTSVPMGGALVLGLAHHVNTLTLDGPAAASLGDHPRFTITSSRGGPAVVRCHFYGPDGAFLHLYARNVVLVNGAATVVLPSALNDAPGEYTLRVTDVITGASATAAVRLDG